MREHITLRAKLGFLFILVLISIKYVYVPVDEMKKNNLEKIFVLKKQINSGYSVISQKKDLEEKSKEIDFYLKKLKKNFFNDFKEPEDLLLLVQKEIEKSIRVNKVKTISSRWGEVFNGEIAKAPVQLTLVGNESNLHALITAIENNEKLFTIDRYKITAKNNDEKIYVQMVVSGYGVMN